MIVALSAASGRAGAGDLEDCDGRAADKVESVCTTVIDDAKASESGSRFAQLPIFQIS